MTGFIEALYYNPSESQSITTAHNQWLSETRFIPYSIMSVFSLSLPSTVTDFVLIYESLASSKDDLRITKGEWRMKN
jgi:hypothetical protein